MFRIKCIKIKKIYFLLVLFLLSCDVKTDCSNAVDSELERVNFRSIYQQNKKSYLEVLNNLGRWKCFEREVFYVNHIEQLTTKVNHIHDFNGKYFRIIQDNQSLNLLHSVIDSFKLEYDIILKDTFTIQCVQENYSFPKLDEVLFSVENYKLLLLNSLLLEREVFCFLNNYITNFYDSRSLLWDFSKLPDRFDCETDELPPGFILSD